MNRVVIKQNQFKTLWLLLIGCILDATCIWLLHINLSKRDFLYVAFGSVFFAVCVLYILYRLIKPRDVLVIASDGFTDASSSGSVGFVPWSNVERIYIGKVKIPRARPDEEFICVTLHNTEAVLSELPSYKRFGMEFNISAGNAPIMIGFRLASESIETVFPMMQEYYEASLASKQKCI